MVDLVNKSQSNPPDHDQHLQVYQFDILIISGCYGSGHRGQTWVCLSSPQGS